MVGQPRSPPPAGHHPGRWPQRLAAAIARGEHLEGALRPGEWNDRSLDRSRDGFQSAGAWHSGGNELPLRHRGGWGGQRLLRGCLQPHHPQGDPRRADDHLRRNGRDGLCRRPGRICPVRYPHRLGAGSRGQPVRRRLQQRLHSESYAGRSGLDRCRQRCHGDRRWPRSERHVCRPVRSGD
ncbi:hypothetical protein D3C87_1439340 [compost metagenome]